MQSAAGGTSQRLKPAVAIVRSLSRNPVPAPGMLPVLLIVVIAIFPCSPLLYWAFITVFDPVVVSHMVEQPHPAVPRSSGTRGDRHAHSRIRPDVLIVLAAMPVN
jgi:hypothetical protein